MGNKLYVGNLPYSMTQDGLKDVFAQAGEVSSAKVVTDRDSGRSKGFGFVEMSTDDAAMAAIEQLNNKEIAGRALRVSEARPFEPKERRPFNNSRRGDY